MEETVVGTVHERRRFLRDLVAMGGTGVFLALGTDNEPVTASADGTPLRAVAADGSGYRLSAHVRAYYASARS